jgi:hypothetical protein
MPSTHSGAAQPLAIFQQDLFVDFPLLLRRFFLLVKQVLQVLDVVLFLLVLAINKRKLLLEPLFFQLVLHMQLLHIFDFFAELKGEIVFQRCGIIS